MLTGKPPFDGRDRKTLASNILKHQSNLTQEEKDAIPEDAYDLMKQLLNPDMYTRIEATEAMNHEWIMKLTK